MQVSVSDAGTLRKQVTIHIDSQELTERENQLLGRYANGAKLKGFRQGKAPRALLKKRWGTAVRGEAQEALLQEGMQKAIQDNDLQPIGPLSNDEHNEEDGLKTVTSFDVRPTITLPKVEELSVTIEDTSVSDEDVQAELDGLAQRSGSHDELSADDKLVENDVIKLTGSITSGEETVREVHDLNHVIGAYPLFNKEPADVIALCADKKIGDELAFDTTLPENFQPEEWAGKDATVTVTIQSAQRQTPATQDDEFAKRFGAENMDDLKDRMRQMGADRKANELHGRQSDELIDALIEKTSFDLPPKLFEQLVEDNFASRKEQAPEGEEFDEEAQKKEVSDEVERHLRRMLLLDAIADERQVQATQSDLQQQIAMAAYQSGRKPEELLKQLQDSGRLMEVASDIRQHKALEVVLQDVITHLSPSEDEAPADKAETQDADSAPKKSAVKKKKKASAEAEAEAEAEEAATEEAAQD